MSFTSSIDEIVAENANKLLGARPHWKRVKLREVCEILNGYPFESSKFSKERGKPLIRIRDILPGTTETYYEGEVDPTFIVQPGELVVGMDGDFHCDFWRGEPALLNQRVCKITPDETCYSLRFLRHVLPGYLSAIHAKTHSVTVKHLSSKTVGDIPLPFPPLDEQRRIVAELETHLTRLDASVTSLKRVQANLKRYRASVLKAACEGRLVPTEAELARREGRSYESADDLLTRALSERRAAYNKGKYQQPNPADSGSLPPIPAGWKWATFEQLSIRVTVGFVGPMKHEYVESGVPFLRSQNVRENRFDPEGLLYVRPEFHARLSKSAIRPGDLAIVRSGSVGVTCVVPDTLQDANCADLVLVQRPLGLVPNFAAYYMNSIAKRRVEAGKVGVALTHFNTKAVAAMPVPLPPFVEQQRIVAEVERRLAVIEELEATVAASLKRAVHLQKTILSMAFDVEPSRGVDHAP